MSVVSSLAERRKMRGRRNRYYYLESDFDPLQFASKDAFVNSNWLPKIIIVRVLVSQSHSMSMTHCYYGMMIHREAFVVFVFPIFLCCIPSIS